MNQKLKQLFELHNLPDKDQHDFMQIYMLLPKEKQIRVLENFATIVEALDEHRADLYVEYDLLFSDALRHIEETLQSLYPTQPHSLHDRET